MPGAEPSFERSLTRPVPAALERAGDRGDRHPRPNPPHPDAWRAARGPGARNSVAVLLTPGRFGDGGATSDSAGRPGPGGADLADDQGRVVGTAAARAADWAAEGRRRPADCGRRLWSEVKHPPLAPRARLQGDRAAAHRHVVGRADARSGRPGAVERPGRSFGARRAG